MTAKITIIRRRAHLNVGHVEMPLMADDVNALLDRLTHIDLWEARDEARAHKGDLRLSRGLVRTLPGRIAVATATQRDHDTLDVQALLEPLLHMRERDNRGPAKQAPIVVPDSLKQTLETETGHVHLICIECDKVFPRTANNQRYCGTRCRQRASQARYRARIRTRTCPTCGIEFKSKSGGNLFCTADCRLAEVREKAKQRPCGRCKKPLGAPRIRLHPECKKDGAKVAEKVCKWCKRKMHTKDARRLYHPRCIHARNYVAAVIENGHESADMDAEFMQWHRLRTRAQRRVA